MSTVPKTPEVITVKFGNNEYDIQPKHTGAALARQIVNVNSKTIYTPINMIGMPGFGKTTGTHQLVYEIRRIDPSYAIHWYEKDDLLEIDKILDNLPKHQNCILVFDDVSYLLEDLTREQRKNILHKLTIIREILDKEHKRTRCILMLDFHYSYAVPKAFRQANFSIQFSITDEERENYLKRVGYSKKKQRQIALYTRLFESAYKFGVFKIKTPGGKEIEYSVDNPFRPALVFNFSQIHLWLFHPVADAYTGPKKGFDAADTTFWRDLVRKYGYSRVHKVLRMYVFTHTGKAVIPAVDKKIWNHIQDQNAELNLPMEDIETILRGIRKLPRENREETFLKSLDQVNESVIQQKAAITKEEEKITAEQIVKSFSKDMDIEEEEEDETEENDEFNFDDGINQQFGGDDAEE